MIAIHKETLEFLHLTLPSQFKDIMVIPVLFLTYIKHFLKISSSLLVPTLVLTVSDYFNHGHSNIYLSLLLIFYYMLSHSTSRNKLICPSGSKSNVTFHEKFSCFVHQSRIKYSPVYFCPYGRRFHYLYECLLC